MVSWICHHLDYRLKVCINENILKSKLMKFVLFRPGTNWTNWSTKFTTPSLQRGCPLPSQTTRSMEAGLPKAGNRMSRRASERPWRNCTHPWSQCQVGLNKLFNNCIYKLENRGGFWGKLMKNKNFYKFEVLQASIIYGCFKV